MNVEKLIITDDSYAEVGGLAKRLGVGSLLKNRKTKKINIIIFSNKHKEQNGTLELRVAMLDEIKCGACGGNTNAADIPTDWFRKNVMTATIRDKDKNCGFNGYRFSLTKCPLCSELVSLDDDWEVVNGGENV